MRTINHDLQKRGDTYYFVKRVPSDVRPLHRGAEWIKESLKTTKVATARRMRDERLRQLDRQWAAYRVLPSGQHLSREEMREALDYYHHVHSGEDRPGWVRAAGERASELYEEDVPEELHGEVGSKRAGEFHSIASGKKLPIKVAIDQFLGTAKLKPTTQALYRVMFKQLTAKFAFIEDMTHGAIRMFLREYQSTRTPKAIRNLIGAGRSLLAFHGLDADVFKGHRIDAGKEQVKKGIWTDGEALRLANANTSQWLRDCITVALYSGLRRKEVSGLVYDREKDQLVVRAGTAKTPNSVRRIPCHPQARDAARRIAALPESISLKAITEGFHELVDNMDLPRTIDVDGVKFKRDFHALRHTFASKLGTLDASEWQIARIIGHSRKGVTRQYSGKFDPEVDRPLIENVSYSHNT